MPRPRLTIDEILAWADAHRAYTRKWPEMKSRRVRGTLAEDWRNIDQALRKGLRGLRPGSSLARLLAKRRGKRNRKALPKFKNKLILRWADAHHARTGKWPFNFSGPINDAPGETWYAVDMALRKGQRGMRPGSSLAKLLAAKRGVRLQSQLPRLSTARILAWADAHYRKTGNWPTDSSGPILQSPIDTWYKIDKSLRLGYRGLRGKSSLARLLRRHRGVTRYVRQPPLTIATILSWADAHHERHGTWPTAKSGVIPEVPGETWQRVNTALRLGKRGLPGGQTVAAALALARGVRSRASLPKLTEATILRWARSYRRRHGRWPTRESGIIPESGGETWAGVNWALKSGRRGIPRRTSLSRLLRAV
jgi:hypothetical protein